MHTFLSRHHTFSLADSQFMAQAIQLAGHGLYTTAPNPRVGCVLAQNNVLIASGWHQKAGGPHAEIVALTAAGADARGATAYVSLEPCSHQGRTPPCADALIAAGVKRVVAAMVDPNPRVSGQGLKKLHEAGIDVSWGLLEDDAKALNPGFILRMQEQGPWVRAKVASSLDGRSAMASGESKWITGPAARADVQRWRAQSGALVMGINSILRDDPSMTVRQHDWLGQLPELWHTEPIQQPLRVVLDSHLRIPLSSKILAQDGKTLVITLPDTLEQQKHKVRQLSETGIDVVSGLPSGQRLDLTGVLQQLVQRDINEVLVESGPTLTGAFLHEGLIDELILYMAPKLMGDQAQAAFILPGLERINQCPPLRIKDIRQVGEDVRIIASPQRADPHNN